MTDDRSYLYGDGLFETVRVTEQGPRALDLHVARFVRSANELGYPDPCIHAGVAALQALRGAAVGIHRVTVTRDDDRAPFQGTGGITVRVRPIPTPRRPRLCLLPGWYLPEDSLAEHKSTSYLRHVEVRRRAELRGADDALTVSADGWIGEASTANVFFQFPSGLVTPPARGILPGITRQRIIDAFDVLVRRVHVDELGNAAEILLTNAAQIAVAALDIEGRSLTHYAADDFIEALEP